MLTALLLWAGCAAGSMPLLELDDRISIDPARAVWQAPRLPEWPADLPAIYLTPHEAKCFDIVLEFELGEGIWLPRLRSDFEGRFITQAFAVVDEMQQQLDDIRLVEVPALVDAEIKRHLAAGRARWLRERADDVRGSFQDWFVGVMVVGAAIVGALLYAGAYAIMHD